MPDSVDADFPWPALLPEPNRTEFVDEHGRALDAASAHKSDAPSSSCCGSGPATAEIHADSRLARRLGTAITAAGDRVVPPKVKRPSAAIRRRRRARVK